MEVVSVRVPEDIKKRMQEADINWSEEIRQFIESKIKEYQRKNALNEIKQLHRRLPETKKGTAVQYVRDDRDSH